MDTKATEEVAHGFVRSFGERLLHFIEPVTVLREIGDDVGDGIANLADFVGRKHIDGADEPNKIKAFAQ